MAGDHELRVTGASWFGSGLRSRHPVLFALLALDLGLLVLQYGLGMYVNLYVQVPFGNGPGPGGMMGAMGMGGMWGQPALAWHMMDGWLVFLVTLLVAVVSLTTRDTWLMLTSWAGLVSVGVAGAGGMGFLMSGGENGFSFLMALGALGALLAISAALLLVWKDGTVQGERPTSPPEGPRELLDMKYARGEVGREDYLRAKRDLNPGKEFPAH